MRAPDIHALCNGFEEGWRTGQPPLLEEVVRAAEEADREELFRHLLGIEWAHRAKAGRPLAVSEARERFAALGPWTAAAILDLLADTRSWSKSPASGDAPDPAPVRYIVGQYELHERLGRGSFGTVFKAVHLALKRVVVVKLLHAHRVGSADGLARFRRETEALGRLNHPHVVRATDAGETDGYCYVAMDYVEGADLSRVLAAGPLAVADACEMIRQAADGLAYIDKCGLVHRDIKPSNILLGRDGVIRILDLGLARLTDPDAERFTHTGVVMGSADYISPEQARESRNVDIRADVYSLGCTLYALLAGAAPYADPIYGSAYDKFRAHIEVPVPPLAAHRPDAPPELLAVLERMLAKEPGHRFQSPADVSRELAAFCSGHDLPTVLARATLTPARCVTPLQLPATEMGTSLPSVSGTTTRTFAGLRGRRRWPGRLAVLTAVLLLVAGFLALSDRFGPAHGQGSNPPPTDPVPVGGKGEAPEPPPRVFKPGEWVELLDRPPTVLAWPNPAGVSEWRLDDAAGGGKWLRVNCTGYAMFQLAELAGVEGYEVEMTFSQNPWVGGIGLSVRGRHEMLNGKPHMDWDEIHVDRFDQRRQPGISVGRSRVRTYPSKQAVSDGFRSTLLPRVTGRRHVVRALVQASGLSRCSLDQISVADLLFVPGEFEVQRASADGAVGLCVSNATVVVESFRVRLTPRVPE